MLLQGKETFYGKKTKEKYNRKQCSKNQRSKKPRNRQQRYHKQRYQKQRENYCSQQDYENIQITDDFMFGTVFSYKEDCKEFLQRILQIRILEIRIVTPQQSIRNRKDGKGIRLDVYVRDDQGNSYDIEMQLLDTKELDLRSRYYHSEMDTYQIRKGKKYKNLKESIVIFVLLRQLLPGDGGSCTGGRPCLPILRTRHYTADHKAVRSVKACIALRI